MPPNESLFVAAPLLVAAIVMAFRFVGCGIDADPIPGTWDGNGDGDGDGGKPTAVTANFTGTGVLSAQAAFPQNKHYSQDYEPAGTYTFDIPYWCDTIDMALLGAGGGGMYSAFNAAAPGGAAGGWKMVSLRRGSDIPWEATSITVTVGQGGAGGTVGMPQGGAGGDTTATWDTSTGTNTASGTGGAAAAAPDLTGAAPDPSSKTVDNVSLNAGTEQPTLGGTGNPPGGGGAGGDGFKPGGAGADGAALLVASQQQN